MERTLRLLQLLMLIVCLTGVTTAVSAQSRLISGTVTSQEDAVGMPGVNVIIKGTTTGTTTDASGKYSIEVPSGDNVLVFSFVGYETQEVQAGTQSTINVGLTTSSQQLNEVIVVGYSEKKKQEITGAVVNVSADKLKGVTGSNLEYQLQGKVAGVQVSAGTGAPGTSAEIRIRGNTSITADRGPLIVVDGIMGGTYNPNDVASITVLKDAAAVALYGSRANQGVIIVTTKRGTTEKPEISFKTTVGLRNITTGKFKLMDSQQLYNTERLMFASSADFNIARPASVLETNTDWLGLAYKEALIQNHNISVRGKSSRLSYYVAGDYYDEEGTLINTGYKRYNFRTNLDFELSKAIRLTTNLNITRDNTASYHWRWPYQPFLYLPYDTPYDTDGSYRFVDGTTPGFRTRDKNNIFHSALYNDYDTKGLALNGDVVLTANITPWLSFQSRNRIGMANYRSDTYEDVKTIEAQQYNGYLSFNTSNDHSIISTNLLRANYDFGKHSVGGFVGFEGSKYNLQSAGGYGIGVVSGIRIPGGVATPQQLTGTETESRAMSFLSEVNYNFDEKYFASLAVRRDGSSIFGANKRWGNFGALSGSWIVSKENFFAAAREAVPFLKLRGSYGIVGNDNIAPFMYLAKYNFAAQYNGGSAGYPETLSNPDLGWEQTKSTNGGVDITILKGIDVTLDAFYKDTDRLLLKVPVPSSQGISEIYKNAARLVTKGFEIGISGDVISKPNLTWNVGFNIGTAQNRVKEVADGTDRIPRYYDGLKQTVKAGEDVNSWYLPKWAGVNPQNGEPQWEVLKEDGSGGMELTNSYPRAQRPENLQIVATATPKFYGGLSTSATYMRFTLSIASSFMYGNKIYHRTREFIDADGAYFNFNMMQLADGWSRWQNPGDNATHPKPLQNGNMQSNKPSSRYIEDGSYLRIRNITLSYNLPTALLSKIGLTNASIFISGDNLFTFTKFSGMDPDTQSYTRDQAGTMAGMNDFKYPISKQYLAGLQISF